MGADRGTGSDVHVLTCARCPRVSTATARGWRAYRTDEPLKDVVPALAFSCPECSARDLGEWSRKVQGS